MNFGNNPTPQPTNNLWFGNNYSSGYSQMSRSNYPMNPNMPIPTNPMMQQQTGQPQTVNNILQVMGPESADLFKVGPNSHAILVDSSRPVVYLKHSDDSGFSETKAFQITEIPLFPDRIQAQPSEIKTGFDYITKEEFTEFKNSMEEFKSTIEELVTKNG